MKGEIKEDKEPSETEEGVVVKGGGEREEEAEEIEEVEEAVEEVGEGEWAEEEGGENAKPVYDFEEVKGGEEGLERGAGENKGVGDR